MKLEWKQHKTKNPDSAHDSHYYTARTPIGTFYAMAYGAKYGASLLPFNKHNGAGDIEIGKLRLTVQAAQNDAQRFMNAVTSKLKPCTPKS